MSRKSLLTKRRKTGLPFIEFSNGSRIYTGRANQKATVGFSNSTLLESMDLQPYQRAFIEAVERTDLPVCQMCGFPHKRGPVPSHSAEECERRGLIIEEFKRHQEVKAAGFAGMSRKTGYLCDRRDEPDAIPLQKNSLLGIPEPQPLPQS